jgi:CheY-like chemotaxis protein
MPDGGSLTIMAANEPLGTGVAARAVPANDYVVVTVEDTGVGMPAEVASRVFEPFYTTKPAGKGTGLGLSQVYGFITQSAGFIFVESKVGSGTRVTIYLPRSRSAVQTAMPNSLVASETGSEHVLVVEDNSEVRIFIADALAELGYRITAAPNAEEALAIVQADHSVDLLITDVVLPGKNGRALAQEVAVLRPALPVLYMTGYDRGALTPEDLELGNVLRKPLTADTLGQAIRDALQNSRLFVAPVQAVPAA